MEISIAEIVGLIYILMGIAVCCMAHIKSYGDAYEEHVPVIFRLTILKRWIQSLIEQVKI
ncbi:hypothetical protein [Ekhidna sp.]|uniref:hypothetical protein n=1 Tax=Ekhidna sp. TaxID=2608089 RepID=UPI003298130F